MLMWQATDWRPVSVSAGSSLPQISSARGQRVRKRQPDGGLMTARLELRAPGQKGRDLEVSVIGRLTTTVEP